MEKKVLIIDDSITQLSSLKIFFKREGFEVITANNGIEGYVKVYKETPDLIISDVLMPHLGGYQLCRLLKSNKETKDIPFIMLTVLDKNLDKFWASQSGADIFLRKDYAISDIVSAAKDIITKMPVSDSVKKELLSNEIEEDTIITRINKILDEELMKSTITNKFREINDYTKDDKTTAQEVFKIVSAITDYDLACMYFHSPDYSANKSLIFHEQNISVDEDIMLSILKQILPHSMSDFKPEKIPAKEDLTPVNSLNDLVGRVELDFYYNETLIGKLCLFSRENQKWHKMRFLPTIKSELELFLKLKYLYAKTCYLSITDELTHLYTRRHLKSVLGQEFERAKRYGTIVSVAMVDIDDFKQINDKYGHMAGDYILKEVSKLFINTLRKTDFVYRYGGEEICVLMPETLVEKAFVPLERLRNTIANRNFIFEGKKVNVTISIGAATFDKIMREPVELLERADAALYKAKKNGKNQVVMDNNE